MSVHMFDLGHYSLTRSKAQVHASAHATASFSPDLPCSDSDALFAALYSCSRFWFSKSPNLEIYVHVSFDHSLCLNFGQRNLIGRTLAQSIARAELGLVAYLDTADWSSTTCDATLALKLSTADRQSTTNGSDCDHDASSVQPPPSLSVHRLSVVRISINLARTAVKSHTRSTPSGRDPTSHNQCVAPSFKEVLYPEQHSIPTTDLGDFEALFREHATGVIEKSLQIRDKAVLSLIDACFRNFLYAPTRASFVRQASEAPPLDLASLAPSVFMPGHVQQLSSRAHLIQPIARFLSTFKTRAPFRRFAEAQGLQSSYCNDNPNTDNNHEACLSKEEIAGQLWMVMTNVLSAKRPGKRLRSLVFEEPSDTSQEPSETSDSILSNTLDDNHVNLPLSPGSYFDETSLFDCQNGTSSSAQQAIEFTNTDYELQNRVTQRSSEGIGNNHGSRATLAPVSRQTEESVLDMPENEQWPSPGTEDEHTMFDESSIHSDLLSFPTQVSATKCRDAGNFMTRSRTISTASTSTMSMLENSTGLPLVADHDEVDMMLEANHDELMTVYESIIRCEEDIDTMLEADSMLHDMFWNNEMETSNLETEGDQSMFGDLGRACLIPKHDWDSSIESNDEAMII